MHAVAAFLTHRHVGGPGVLDHDLVQMILVGERADRGGVPDEYQRPGTMPSRVIRVRPDYAQRQVTDTAPTSGNTPALRITQRCS